MRVSGRWGRVGVRMGDDGMILAKLAPGDQKKLRRPGKWGSKATKPATKEGTRQSQMLGHGLARQGVLDQRWCMARTSLRNAVAVHFILAAKRPGAEHERGFRVILPVALQVSSMTSSPTAETTHRPSHTKPQARRISQRPCTPRNAGRAEADPPHQRSRPTHKRKEQRERERRQTRNDLLTALAFLVSVHHTFLLWIPWISWVPGR